MNRNIVIVSLSIGLALWVPAAMAADLHIAAASNFTRTATDLARLFDRHNDTRTRLSFSSTGKLYAQVRNGAPYDIFMAADTQRPDQLLQDQQASRGQVYAYGRLVLFSTRHEDCRRALQHNEYQWFAIANEKLAPFGAAARDWLQSRGYWAAVSARLVRGENVGQAVSYLVTGNADLGLIPLSYLERVSTTGGCHYRVPADEHAPIAQKAVLLNRAADNPVAIAFFSFMASQEARDLISAHGYLPGGEP